MDRRDLRMKSKENRDPLRPEDASLLSRLQDHEPAPAGSTPSIAAEHAPVLKAKGFFREQPPQRIWNAWALSTGTRIGRRRSGFSTEPCAFTTMLRRHSIRKIA